MHTPTDIAIVGLGPVGAALAARLGARGLRVAVFEQSTKPHTLPRAAHLDEDALRVLQSVGILDDLLDHGRPIDGFDLVNAKRARLLRARPRPRWPVNLPAGLLIHQPTVETALRARLDELATVDVYMGHTIERIEPDAEGVTVSGTAAAPFSIRATYVVGCDGARSVVREAMGSPLRGGRFEQTWLVVDALVPEDAPLPNRLLQIANPRQPATYVPFPGRRRRWEFKLADCEDAALLRQPDAVRERLSAWIDPVQVEIERATLYTFHDLTAQGWRKDRVLIAGDAAHQMPPFLGQGLGAGLHDSATLAWMLELVVRGAADPTLLDVYEAERRPHVEATTRLAVRLGRLISASGPLAHLRNALLGLANRIGLGPRLRSIEAPLPRVETALATWLTPNHGPSWRPDEARLPQPMVGRGDAVLRLDDVLGLGFAVIGIGLDAETWAGQDPVWRQLEATCVTLGAGVWDPDGLLTAWASAEPCVIVARPDRLVFGIYKRHAKAQAVADLRRALSLR
ncbi:MAG: bifunctional 3-(3-hydroxy-phenyl)propionate/3-hydroxycinnamic acid hydroxylase [Bacteroidota bacterium]